MKKAQYKNYYLPVLILLLVLLPPGCKRKSVHEYSKQLIGTDINITVITETEYQALKASGEAFEAIKNIEKMMSPKSPEGDIYQINRNAGIKPVRVTPDTFSVIKKSLEIGRMTGGSFDISFAVLGGLWNYKKSPFVPPTKQEVSKILPLVNFRNIKLDEEKSEVFLLKKGMKIGLGGIAKGYAIGRAVDKLRQNGVKEAIVDAGGDLQVIGSNMGKAWTVGLMHPREKAIILSLPLNDNDCIVTSGDYERFTEYKGKRYHHIIDPKKGFPARGLSSVSVIAKDPMDSDALATAFFVMGKNRTMGFIRRNRDYQVILIDDKLNIFASRELKDRIKLLVKGDIHWF